MNIKCLKCSNHELITRSHVQVLVDCSGEDEIERNPETAFLNKKSALLHLVEGRPVSKTIVFCNKVHSSSYALGALCNSSIAGLCLTVIFAKLSVSYLINMHKESIYITFYS